MANASVHVMEMERGIYETHTTPMLSHINVGTGEDVTIREVAETIRKVVGYQGDIEFDTSKPDGTPRKLMDIAKLSSLGWHPEMRLAEGIAQTYRHFVADVAAAAKAA
jgi:GDP-L-fucose synthase